MSNLLSESTTVAEWLDRMPAKPELHSKAPGRTDEQKLIDLEWHKQLFDGADSAQVTCLIVYCVQVLKDRDIRGAIYLLEQLQNILESEMIESLLPPALLDIIKKIKRREEN